MKPKEYQPNAAEPARAGFFSLALFSLLALGAVFFFTALEIGFAAKASIFAAVSGAYLLICFLLYFRQPPPIQADSAAIAAADTPEPPSEEIFSPETREKLLALEEASLIFGSALKLADMFRLVANRVAEIVPFQTMVLFLSINSEWRAAHAFGAQAAEFIGNPEGTARGIARKTFENRGATVDPQMNFDRLNFSAATLLILKSAVGVPMWREGEICGVLALYGEKENAFDTNKMRLLEAVAARVSPLFLNSMAFEANLNKALTDSVTGLPNERALFLVLENQIAEAQRNREGRALTVLSIDIKDLDRLNKEHGHQTGDRILSFAAGKIKDQLRQMDFLSRVAGDEFLAVLPTASGEIADAIVARIEKTFAAESFDAEGQEFNVELNFGAASFSTDAESAAELLGVARRRENDAKSPVKGSILQFPERFPH